MTEVLFYSFAERLFYATLIVGYLWLVLRLWNLLSGDMFNASYRRFMANDLAAALYCGLRFVGLCLVVFAAFS